MTWRTKALLDAGFGVDAAATLSRSTAVDLHELFALVDRGCPALLAARIVAPDECRDA